MNIDTLLRETMRAHADDAPPGAGLGSAARQRAQRRRTHQVLAGGVTALAAVVAVAVAVPLLVQPGADGPPPGTLVPFELDLPEFPYTPGWIPDGLAEPYVELRPAKGLDSDGEATVTVGEMLRAVHEPEGTDREAEPAPLVMATTPYDPIAAELDPELLTPRPGQVVADTEPVTVRGRTATLATLMTEGWLARRGGWLVAWQERPDLWVQVYAATEVGRRGLLRYVAELVPEPLPVSLPFTLAVAPAGAEPTHVSPDLIWLESMSWPGEPGAVPVIVSVTLRLYRPADVDDALPSAYTSTTVYVNGRPAELIPPRGKSSVIPAQLILPMAPDMVLVIDSVGNEYLSVPELLTFAEGITLTRHARPWPGS